MGRKSIHIGQLIREIRKGQRMSQMRLAAAVGVSYQQIQKYEKGTSAISVDRLKQISKALNTPVMTFFPAEGKNGNAKAMAAAISTEEKALLDLYRGIRGKGSRTAFFEFSKLVAKNKALLRKLCPLKNSCN
jgi:transcriptional regulator with XRE-family HTH domain